MYAHMEWKRLLLSNEQCCAVSLKQNPLETMHLYKQTKRSSLV
jgi:hypothetical protein